MDMTEDNMMENADDVSKEDAKEQEKEHNGGLKETLHIIIYAVLIALVVRTFFFEPFNIPSASMEPTLQIGDYLFVSKTSYGYSRYSLPFSLPLFDGRVMFEEPKRGDVIVFRRPLDTSEDYIKRLIGFPGDEIQMIDGHLYINGVPTQREEIEPYIMPATGRESVRYRETLPNGVSYEILDSNPHGRWDNTGVYVVPEGHYFMMGDNRDNSSDSRVMDNGVGFVPRENLVGRADLLFFSVHSDHNFWNFWKLPAQIRYERIFERIE